MINLLSDLLHRSPGFTAGPWHGTGRFHILLPKQDANRGSDQRQIRICAPARRGHKCFPRVLAGHCRPRPTPSSLMWFSRRNGAFQNKFNCFCPFLLARHWPTQTALVRSARDAYPFSKPVKPPLFIDLNF
jgi:hypothetical protein